MKKSTTISVSIRFRALKNGKKSAYFDVYNNGKRFYKPIILNGHKVVLSDKENNRETLKTIEILRAKTEEQYRNGYKPTEILLSELLINESNNNQLSISTKKQYQKVAQYIEAFSAGNMYLSDIKTDFYTCFCEYLTALKLHNSTILIYLSKVKKALKNAYKRGLFPIFPQMIEATIKSTPTARNYLTASELNQLETYYEKQPTEILRAFLFACFCGLRYSDIASITSENITRENDSYYITITQQKTRENIHILLIDKALKYLHLNKNGKQFDLKQISYYIYTLQKAFERAKINKHISFHCSRHTFATLLLAKGANLYVVSKLLGHKDIKTTQIYTKIIDTEKDNAIKQLNNI